MLYHPLDMKAYLATTGGLFALLGAAHAWLTIDHYRRLGEDPWFILEGPGIGLVASALALWAWRLGRSLRPQSRATNRVKVVARSDSNETKGR